MIANAKGSFPARDSGDSRSNPLGSGPLTVRLRGVAADDIHVEVDLSGIAARAGHGEERHSQPAAVSSTAPVRLRLPPTRDGEVRLPDELDGNGVAPKPRECGRIVDGSAELTSLAVAAGHCGICLGQLTDTKRHNPWPVILLRCGHPFHESCIGRWFEERRSCPSCKRRYGHIVGNQPCVGQMTWKLESNMRLAGCQDCFTIVLGFKFPPGKDALGQHYRGRTQRAYLPHNEGGKLLLELFRLAFRRRVLFDLRVSATDDKYWPAFNIHLKTATSGGPTNFGFPDDGYFQRAMEELREHGVTLAELG